MYNLSLFSNTNRSCDFESDSAGGTKKKKKKKKKKKQLNNKPAENMSSRNIVVFVRESGLGDEADDGGEESELHLCVDTDDAYSDVWARVRDELAHVDPTHLSRCALFVEFLDDSKCARRYSNRRSAHAEQNTHTNTNTNTNRTKRQNEFFFLASCAWGGGQRARAGATPRVSRTAPPYYACAVFCVCAMAVGGRGWRRAASA